MQTENIKKLAGDKTTEVVCEYTDMEEGRTIDIEVCRLW